MNPGIIVMDPIITLEIVPINIFPLLRYFIIKSSDNKRTIEIITSSIKYLGRIFLNFNNPFFIPLKVLFLSFMNDIIKAIAATIYKYFINYLLYTPMGYIPINNIM